MDRLAGILSHVEGIQFDIDFPTGPVAELGAFGKIGNGGALNMVNESESDCVVAGTELTRLEN